MKKRTRSKKKSAIQAIEFEVEHDIARVEKTVEKEFKTVEKELESVVMHHDHLKLRMLALLFAIAASNSLLLLFFRSYSSLEAYAFGLVVNLLVIAVAGASCVSHRLIYPKSIFFASLVVLEFCVLLVIPGELINTFLLLCFLVDAAAVLFLGKIR